MSKRLHCSLAGLFMIPIAVPAAAQEQAASTLPPSPIARIEVTPRVRTVTAGDSVRLEARALDASGRPVSGARVFFSQRAGFAQGVIDSSGTLVASNVGKFPLAVTAIVPGTRPVIDSTLEIVSLPGPATHLTVGMKTAKIVAGQDLRLTAVPFSKMNDRTRDRLEWSSSAPTVARVSEDGVVTGVGAGRATIKVSAGRASQSIPVDVVRGPVVSLSVSPNRPAVRQGDVVKLSVTARDASGQTVTGLTPTWSFSPGDGQIDSDGSFVAYRPGDYQVAANVGTRTATTVVRVSE